MSNECSNCESEFDYDTGWDDPPKGKGHITATFNPEDEPGFVVSEERHYCDINCLLEDSEDMPFEVPNDVN